MFAYTVGYWLKKKRKKEEKKKNKSISCKTTRNYTVYVTVSGSGAMQWNIHCPFFVFNTRSQAALKVLAWVDDPLS